jgi:hypothetical protein
MLFRDQLEPMSHGLPVPIFTQTDQVCRTHFYLFGRSAGFGIALRRLWDQWDQQGWCYTEKNPTFKSSWAPENSVYTAQKT